MLPAINCVVTKAVTNITVDFSFVHEKWQKYQVALKELLKISHYKMQLLGKISILLQDTVTSKGEYLITRYCNRFKYLDTIFKILRLDAVHLWI